MSQRWLVVALVSLTLHGCYYAHVGRGEASLVIARKPIARVVADPGVDPLLKQRLALALQAREFASARLALPRNRSYTGYVALHRPFVAWNVFATARYSIAPATHCFPFAGCVAYRGYFSQAKANKEAARLRGKGMDVSVGGVPAYSTLGWFNDPVLSSMLRWDDDELAGTIFHELAHQRVYAQSDTTFNESYASFVQRQGLSAWRASRSLPVVDDRDDRMEQSFTELVLGLRKQLAERYERGGDTAELAADKHQLIAGFQQSYANWRDTQWHGDHRYDTWVASDINNASLLPFGLYEQWVPAFTALFARDEGNWQRFHQDVAALAQLPPAERERRLQALLALGQYAKTPGNPYPR